MDFFNQNEECQPPIFLDVTSTALTPTITGIPRVVRNLAHFGMNLNVKLIEYHGLSNSYREVHSLETPSSSATSRTSAGRYLYKSLINNRLLSTITTSLLRNRLVFYLARSLFGAKTVKTALLQDNLKGVLFLPEVPLHISHVNKIRSLVTSPDLKLAVFIHDLLPLQYPEMFSKDLVWKFESFSTLIHSADFILVSNSDVQVQVQEMFGISKAQVVLLPSSFQTNPSSPTQQNFLMVGTIEPRKNHAVALDAFEQLITTHPEVHLNIVGNVGWDYSATQERLQVLEKRGYVTWVKDCSDTQLLEYYQAATALIYPSFYEGYGLPIIEALSQRTPVITSDRPVLRTFTQYGGVVLVDPLSSQSLLIEMNKFLDESFRESRASEIALDSIPTSWAEFADTCFKQVREV